MATNKQAIIRYHALDRCFSNPGRKYFIEDLISACNDALRDFCGISDGVKRRQVFEDIKFMESEQGWSIPLQRHKQGKQIYYRYSDKTFSIKKTVINETEANHLKETLSILTRFKGLPHFEWMEELMVRVESTFNLNSANSAIVQFEQNQYVRGLHHFSSLFNAIQYRKVLNIVYQGFKQETPVQLTLHPYLLKQYNGRWFLFGFNEALNAVSNLALDRILEAIETTKSFLTEDLNFDEYFEDVVGVTVKDQSPVKVLIVIDRLVWPYIESKPIHGSQKIIRRTAGEITIELTVQINYELIATLFAYGEALKVIEPEELKISFKSKAEKVLKNYL